MPLVNEKGLPEQIALSDENDCNHAHPQSEQLMVKQPSEQETNMLLQEMAQLGNDTGDPNSIGSGSFLSNEHNDYSDITSLLTGYKRPNFQRYVPKPLFVHINDLLAIKHEVKWLIKGIFETETLNMIFGDPAAGKSFLAVDIACCIASGIEWHGKRVQAGRVIYIAGEGNRGYASRCRAWSISNGVDLVNAPLVFSSKAVSFSDLDSVDSFDAEVVGMLNQSDEPISLIIFDTLARTMDGDENSTQDMARFIAKLDRLTLPL